MTAPSLAPRLSATDFDTELDHRYCCDEDTSLCGLDISALPLLEPEAELEAPCVVCVEMRLCLLCGGGVNG